MIQQSIENLRMIDEHGSRWNGPAHVRGFEDPMDRQLRVPGLVDLRRIQAETDQEVRCLEGVTHHVLRHTGASAMVAARISLRVVQDIGGWSTLRMLERYAHPSGAEMSRAVRVLTAYTTGTKTGTATKNGNGDPKTADAGSAVKSEVTKWRPQRDSNPRFGLERATSWASGRWGRSARENLQS